MSLRTWILGLTAIFGIGMLTQPSFAAPMALADTPLFVSQGASPLTLLVMGRDHKLYYEAYNDSTDLNGDGVVDIHYNPNIIYYGYFDSFKCYTYAAGQFTPAGTTANKKCSGQWSGDFLNYLTTSRMDALRRVLYGGYRSTDNASTTVLERAFIPQDAHSWGKEYTDVATDGYNIADYTPFSLPTAGKRHLFANTTLNGSTTPLLRIMLNQPYRIWEWVSIERPVAGSRVLDGGSGPNVSASITDYTVRVKVCVAGLLEPNCELYPNGKYKPTGILQKFGENDSMKFGLLMGSYGKNLSGGVLRKNIGSITDEINTSTGAFSPTVGIVKNIDRLKIIGFDASYVHNANCGFIFTRDMNEGECRLWGNPIAEMMYEGLRYFAGKSGPTSAFTYAAGGDDDTLGLTQATWQDPYAANRNPWCAKPNLLVISDVRPSYDTDQIPGSYFNSFSGDLIPSLNASSLGQTIWNNEYGSSVLSFIGESGTVQDGTPTPKTVSSFGNIRGLSPEEPNKKGGYYSASVAYYGWLNDLNTTAKNKQNTYTFSIALSSPLPKIQIPVNGHTITLIPFAKSVGPNPPSCLGGINPTQGSFQPTNTIVDFYVESLTPTAGTFRINYEDAQQGADHDMDAIVRYHYQVNGDNTVTISLDSIYAAGCIVQHMGYVISGTTADGVYLEVRDLDTAAASDVNYFLDTPPGQPPGGVWNTGVALPTSVTRTFTPSSGTSAIILNDPLWYAAKWGGFNDQNNNNIPDLQDEWDSNHDGVPDNYFPVNNPLNLEVQLTKALTQIIERQSSATSAAINSGSLNSNTRLYQAIFDSAKWTGQLLSFRINPTDGSIVTSGVGPNGSDWDAGIVLTGQNVDDRAILTYKPSNGRGIPFRWPANPASPGASELDTSQSTALNTSPTSATNDGLGSNRLNYLRGVRSQEVNNGGTFRNRLSLLGDIVNSTPLFIGRPSFHYPDVWPSGYPENAAAYSTFKSTYTNRPSLLFVGANDGMLHAFDAETGAEKLAYIPSPLYNRLNKLTDQQYAHQYYVDGPSNFGDVFYNGAWHTVIVGGLNKGGQGIYALEITDPGNFLEAQAQNIVRWEFTDSNDSDLGYTYSQPAIARLANGRWAAIFGNGYNNTDTDGHASATGNAVLYIVDIETGALIKKIDTGVGTSSDPQGTGRPNGLSTPAVVDANGDHVADYVYAGDLYGNLWKFNINDSNTTNWGVAYSGTPLFVAKSNPAINSTRQPITERPSVARLKNSVNGFVVLFGTGQYLETPDKTNMTTQTFYGIKDTNSSVVADRTQLLQQSILSEQDVTLGSGGTITARITSSNTMTASQKGWYIDLVYGTPAGERSVTNSIVRNGRIIFTTLIPSTDPCDFGGTGWLMELDTQTGARLAISPFDINGDGKFTNADRVNYASTPVTISGQKSTVGIIPTPGIIDAVTVEYKYMPGTSGNIQSVSESPGSNASGRQSWEQLK